MSQAPEQDIINGATPMENSLWGVHPRLYFNAGKIAELKKLVARDPWKRFLATIRKRADEGCSPDNALVYLLTGDRKYYDLAAAAAAKGAALGDHAALALIYDWLYHELDESNRVNIRTVLDREARAVYEKMAKCEVYDAGTLVWNIGMHHFASCAAAGFAIYGDCPNVAPWLRYVLEHSRSITAALGSDGASPEGISYGGGFNEPYVRTIDLVRDLLGDDLYASNAYLADLPYYYLYCMLPRKYIRFQHAHINYGDAVRYNWCGPDNYLRRAAGLYRNPYAQWAADVLEKGNACGLGGAFLNLAWYDPSIKPTTPQRLPVLRHFQDKDLVISRSGWNDNEAVFAFRCGPHAGHHALRNYSQCIGGGHMGPDAGSFVLFAHGDWQICDGGYARKFTAYRNTILVNGIGQTGEGGDWFECVTLRREKRGPRILRVTAAKDHAVITGDATAAYEPQAGLERYWRHVIHLRPDVWVLIDELRAARPSTFDLHFHSHGRALHNADFRPDQPFQPDGARAWTTGGEQGRLRITSLYPADTEGFAEVQSITDTGGQHERKMDLLRLRNARPTKRTVFITVLEAFPAKRGPGVRLSLRKSGAQLILEVTQRGVTRRIVAAPFSRDTAHAITVNVPR